VPDNLEPTLLAQIQKRKCHEQLRSAFNPKRIAATPNAMQPLVHEADGTIPIIVAPTDHGTICLLNFES